MVSCIKVYSLVPDYVPTVKFINLFKKNSGVQSYPPRWVTLNTRCWLWTFSACVVLSGSVICYPANDLSSNVRPKDKDTIWMVLFIELCFKTAVLVQFTFTETLFYHKKLVIFTLLYRQRIWMKCERNIETMTYIDSRVIWLPTWIHSVWKNKLDIPCKSTIFCKKKYGDR